MDSQKIQTIIDQAPALITLAEGRLLFESTRHLKAEGVIVEIGSYKGGSTIFLALGSQAGPNKKIYAIDPHTGLGPIYENTKNIFLSNLEKWQVRNLVEPIFEKSKKAAKKWNQPISLLWIDGSHWYCDVKTDIFCWEEFLIPGGLIIFHDVVNPKKSWKFLNQEITRYPGVEQAVSELLASGRFKAIKTLDNILMAEKIKNELTSVSVTQIRWNYFFRKIFWLELKYLFWLSLVIKTHHRLGQTGLFLKKYYPKFYYFLKRII